MKLTWSPLAIDRVAQAADRIAQDRPQAAERWAESIFGAVRRLEAFPESGRPVAEAEHRSDLREVLHGDYRIIYRIEPEQLLILTVRHARRFTRAQDIEQ